MIRYIDEHKDRFRVEPICRALSGTAGGFMTSRGYRAAKTRPASARAVRDELLVKELVRVHAENYSVYGVRKMRAAMRREGWEIGRDQVARLMRAAGLEGVRRGREARTTRPDPARPCPADLVNRQFKADRPNLLWVADITYVPTWQGFAHAAFVTDAFSRRIVGWAVSATMRTEDLPLQALDMAAFQATDERGGLICHSDRGSQHVSLRYGERLAGLGALPSVGSKGDSYDNALAEATNALFKTELIKPRKPWKTVEQVELATLQ